MNRQSSYRPILIFVLALGLAQFACGGSQPAAPSLPATQAPAAQPTQAAPPAAGEHGTADEAKSMLQQAVDHYNTAGPAQALADFNARVAPFFDRDLYVVCMGADHVETANGGFPQYVGASADSLTDNAGNPLGKSVWDAASADAVHSVDYHWLNPVSGQTEPKTLYFQKVGDQVCGVGVYTG